VKDITKAETPQLELTQAEQAERDEAIRQAGGNLMRLPDVVVMDGSVNAVTDFKRAQAEHQDMGLPHLEERVPQPVDTEQKV
jgi:hypothetical protein